MERVSGLSREWFDSAFAEPGPDRVGAGGRVSSGRDPRVGPGSSNCLTNGGLVAYLCSSSESQPS